MALLLVSSSLLVVTLVSTTHEWRSRGAGGAATHEQPTLEARRRLALRQLDDLLTEGPHRQGALLDFYTRASGIVRSYVEAMDPDWSSSLTSGELMRRLRARSGEDAAGGLPTDMHTAEVVKFGRLRPGADLAERDWQALRDWVDRSGAGSR